MKSRTKIHRKQPTAIENHPLFNRLWDMLTFKKQQPEMVPCSFSAIILEQNLPQKRLMELEVIRKQEMGMVYANMLPPR